MLPTAPPSAAHPTDPVPPVIARHPTVTKIPAATPMIMPLLSEIQLPVADNPADAKSTVELTADFSESNNPLPGHNPSGSTNCNGLPDAYAYGLPVALNAGSTLRNDAVTCLLYTSDAA